MPEKSRLKEELENVIEQDLTLRPLRPQLGNKYFLSLLIMLLLCLKDLFIIPGDTSSNMVPKVEISCSPGNLEKAKNIAKGISAKSLGYELLVSIRSSEDSTIYETEFKKNTAIYAKALTGKSKILLSDSFFDVTDVGYQQSVIIHEIGHIHYRKQFKFERVPILDLPRKFADFFGQKAKYSNQISLEFLYLTEIANLYNELWADKFLLDTYPKLFLKYALQDKQIKNDNIRIEKEESFLVVYCLNRTIIYSFWQSQFKPGDGVYKICAEMVAKYWRGLNEIFLSHYEFDLTELKKLSYEMSHTLQNIDLINEKYWELSKRYCNLIFSIYALFEIRNK